MPSITQPATTRTLGLRAHLNLLIGAALLPMLVLGLLTLGLAAERLRHDSEARLLETAGVLAHAVDRSILDAIATLRLLTESEDAQRDSRAATAQWRRNKGSGPESRIVHASDPEAATLLPAALLDDAMATNSPQVSSLYFTSERPQLPLVAIAIPGARPGTASALVQRSNHLIDAIATAAAGERLLIAVVDREGLIAARSRNPERFLGQPAPDWQRLTALGTSSGLFEAITKEGGAVIFAFQMLEAAPGWALVIGEPLQTFEARWRGPLLGLALGGLFAAIVALLASHQLARRILHPVKALALRASTVAAGRPHPPGRDPQSTVREFAELQESLEQAEIALQQRARDARELARRLESSQHVYRSVAEAGTLAFWQADADGAMHTVTGWTELTGQPPEQALSRGWLQSIHPDDAAQVEIAWQQSLRHGQRLDVEFRIRDADGQWHWVRLRGVQVTQNRGQEWAGVLEDVDARRQAQAHISYLAHHDPLTGLANRSVLMERLNGLLQARRAGDGAALLCLDLDRFKEVNDTLGHPKGDALLCAVADRLRAQVRQGDLVARLGGDEFAVLQVDSRQPDHASALATRLLEALQAPYDLDGMHAAIGASIGIAIVDPEASSAERLFQNADLALYRVKEEGRGHFRFFEPEMDARMQARRQLEMDIRQALAEQQFELHYQPMLDLQSRELKGFEALLRWNHPTRGLLGPGEFLPLLEEIGLMPRLGQWVLRQACQEAGQWPDHLKVSVNLAASQLDAGLHDQVLEVLAGTQFPPTRLELEVTENALIANLEAASASLLKLKLAGVSIVMDAFGTGYSSIGYLRSFPFDKVKIDRSFVRDLGPGQSGTAIISAVSNLCAKLGITTVVEGVETENQLDQIQADVCDEVQGYLFGQPLHGDALADLIRQAGQRRKPRG